jgi:REDY-like protein HapK
LQQEEPVPTVFFLTRLKKGVDPAAYEKWVREFDYPTAKTIPSILSYQNHRLHGAFRQADAIYDYIEVIEVTDLEAYRRDMDELPQFRELRRQIQSYLEPNNQSYWGERLEVE